MSRLLIVTRPELALGFQLAGIAAYGVPDVETAQEIIGGWLDEGATGLLVLDAGVLARMEPAFAERLETSRLPYVIIPSDELLGPEFSRQHRIAELIRRSVGVHISFTGIADDAS